MSEKNKGSLPIVEDLTFKQASEELEGILRQLESNQLELEESLEKYERGVALLRILQIRLNDAQQRVTVLLGELELQNESQSDTVLG